MHFLAFANLNLGETRFLSDWLTRVRSQSEALKKKEKNYSASRHPFTKVNDKMSAIKSFKLVMSREIGLRYPKLGFRVF